MSKRKMLYLEWVDSSSADRGLVWHDDEVSHVTDLKCFSVGFVVKEDANSITIAGHDAGKSVSGQMTIPKRAITKRRKVAVKA